MKCAKNARIIQHDIFCAIKVEFKCLMDLDPYKVIENTMCEWINRKYMDFKGFNIHRFDIIFRTYKQAFNFVVFYVAFDVV